MSCGRWRGQSTLVLCQHPADDAGFSRTASPNPESLSTRRLQVHRRFVPASTSNRSPHKMVQGKTKGLQAKAANPRHAHKAAANMKKGRRDVAPKKTVLVKQAVMHKVCVPLLVSFLLPCVGSLVPF